ncbi:hypothetical protein GW17_00055317 [Ensete ventricosum]|nr:hypothetical protein GW17_00055317 [Ensete ventricosum]
MRSQSWIGRRLREMRWQHRGVEGATTDAYLQVLEMDTVHATGKNGVSRCCFRCVLTSLPVSLEKRSPPRKRTRRKDAAERASIAELFSGVPSTT